MTTTTARNSLNDRMEFDHVVRVEADGTVTDADGVWAPELHDGEVWQGWTLLNGYSGQWGYGGPIMHASEYIGGGLARDILATPGYYVAVVAYVSPEDDDDPEDYDDVAGWAVAYRPLPE